MRFITTAAALSALVAYASAHGVVTSITGANKVVMPGLSVADGTPRDCATPGCGAEADTSIIRKNGSPLGKTNGNGEVNADSAIAMFMSGKAAATPATTDSTGKKAGKAGKAGKRGLLDALTGGDDGADGANGANGANGDSGDNASGTKTPKGTTEDGVSKAAGTGATSGLPTVDTDGLINMNFHQVNQDGAGALTASVDGTSGGTDATAFQSAKVVKDVPGLGVGGLSGATTTDFPIQVQMPAGMTCDGTSGGASNVCIVKVQNSALAGPFGGSAAFTQTPAAKKRALEYRKLKARHFARGIVGKEE